MKPVSDSSILSVLIGKQMEPIAAEMAMRTNDNHSKILYQVSYKTPMDACNSKFVYNTKIFQLYKHIIILMQLFLHIYLMM